MSGLRAVERINTGVWTYVIMALPSRSVLRVPNSRTEMVAIGDIPRATQHKIVSGECFPCKTGRTRKVITHLSRC